MEGGINTADAVGSIEEAVMDPKTGSALIFKKETSKRVISGRLTEIVKLTVSVGRKAYPIPGNILKLERPDPTRFLKETHTSLLWGALGKMYGEDLVVEAYNAMKKDIEILPPFASEEVPF